MIQNIPDGVDSKFRLVLLIARRAEQLMRGARPKLEADRPMKPTRLAAEEFDDNRIRWDYGAEGGVLEDVEAERADASDESDEAAGEPAEEEATV
jgi:DNA-directed RNA polymerase omega subunit